MVKQLKSALKNAHTIHTGEIIFLMFYNLVHWPPACIMAEFNFHINESRLWHSVVSSGSLVVCECYWCICSHVRETHLSSAQRKHFYSKLRNALIVSVISRIKLSSVRSDLLWIALLQITACKWRTETKNAAKIWLQAAKRKLPTTLRVWP